MRVKNTKHEEYVKRTIVEEGVVYNFYTVNKGEHTNMMKKTIKHLKNLEKRVYLNEEECENLIDALEEWNDVVGPKDCEIHRDEEGYDPNDEEKMCVGLNHDRYTELMEKLRS